MSGIYWYLSLGGDTERVGEDESGPTRSMCPTRWSGCEPTEPSAEDRSTTNDPSVGVVTERTDPVDGGERDSTDGAERDSTDGTKRDTVTITVRHADGETTLTTRRGRTLRDVLLEHDRSPYTRVTERANCGGRGLCATCGVRLREGPEPDHWHDRLAARFGYPRLSCQLTVEDGMVVELEEEKLVWGRRER